jgi:hypothetical protein
MLAAAVTLSLVALGVSMMPMGGSGHDNMASDDADRQPVAEPSPTVSSIGTHPSGTASPPARSSASHTATAAGDKNPDTEPQGTASATASNSPSPTTSSSTNASASCEVAYDLVNQWPDGFQAAITVTTTKALDTWRLAWSYRDGQQVTQMWDASVAQDGSRVTATAADYNKNVAADGSFTFGFLGTWDNSKNSTPYGFTLNGAACTE